MIGVQNHKFSQHIFSFVRHALEISPFLEGAGRGKAHPSSAAAWSFGQRLSNSDADRWRQCVHARTGGAKGNDVRPFSGAHALRQRVRREQLAHEADVDARRSRVPGQQCHVTLWQAQQPQHLRTHGLSNSKMRGAERPP